MGKYIYGAGVHCEACISALDMKEDVTGILDRSPDKWNKRIMGIPVLPVDTIGGGEGDTVVISIGNYVDAVDTLLARKIEPGQIDIFNPESGVIRPLKDQYLNYMEEKLFRQKAIRQIKTGLLLEAYRKREFQDFRVVSVFGEEDDFELVKAFFNCTDGRTAVIREEIVPGQKAVKYILCGADYTDCLRVIRNHGCGDRQWLILPFFDVFPSLDWK